MAVEPKRVQALFLAALEAADRTDFLNRECADDAELRRRVEALLQAHDQPGSLLRQPPGPLGPTADIPPPVAAETVGSVIGPYKLLQKLGEGGMGTVFLAEQERPVKRRVALKIIKPGLDSAHVLARFEAERQALALMDHPNIARVLDAGAIGKDEGGGMKDETEADICSDSSFIPHPSSFGRPYFVMELVKGVPITKYCDQEHLSPQERLALFIPVCQAVQHAHQKGIIHRDLKPSNVLIALYDGKPIPKVIDFGVAKATAQNLTERTMFTEVGQMVGTLEYMSPEQAELNNLDIDTRADIYSLGVLLYELLTGSPPFTGKQLRSAAFDEMLRMIREVEPSKPSTRLSSSEELPAIAARRKLEPKKLTKLVHGELDWIVMKCLEKERGRRYETANVLGLEIQRYLANEPVLAGPPSAAYRLRKFVRRNKGPVVAGAVIVVLLAAGVLGTSIGLMRSLEAETLATERLAELEQANVKTERALEATSRAKTAADRALAASERSRQEAETLSNFLVAAFRRSDPAQDGLELRVVDILDQAQQELDKTFTGSAATKGHLQHTLGSAYVALGLPFKAVNAFERARAIQSEALGADDPNTLSSMTSLAMAYRLAGRIAEALRLHRAMVPLVRQRHGPKYPETLTCTSNLAVALQAAGHWEEACKFHEEVFTLRRETLGLNHKATLVSMTNVAKAYRRLGRVKEAVRLHQEAMQVRKAKFGTDDPGTLMSMNDLGVALADDGRLAEAARLHEEALCRRTKRLGPSHVNTLASMNNLGEAYRRLKRFDEAAKVLEEALKLDRKHLGASHPDTLVVMNNLALTYSARKEHDRAISLFVEVIGLSRKKLGAAHPALAKMLENLGCYYVDLLRGGEAEPILRECLAIRVKQAPDAWTTFDTRCMLGAALLGQKKYAEAEPLLLDGFHGMKERQAKISPQAKIRLTDAVERLVRLYEETGKKDKAARWRKELAAAE